VQRNGDIVRYTAEELDEMRRRGEDRTDWAKLDATTEEELETSIAADPDDVHAELDWDNAIMGLPPLGSQTPVPIDDDLIHWFKMESGGAYQARINEALRAYVETRRAEIRRARHRCEKAAEQV
jgi:uncharacterized protein (DUF4415 family)